MPYAPFLTHRQVLLARDMTQGRLIQSYPIADVEADLP
jgi:hypothetical protein